MRRGIVGLLCLGACAKAPHVASWDAGQWVDLTHAFDENTVYWPTAEQGFSLHVDAYGDTDGGWFYAANSFSTAEHGGTHLDAPIHFARDRWTSDAIPVDRLVGPGVVIDARAASDADRDHLVSVAEFEAWEAEHGRIPDGAIVILNTGFHRFWPDRIAYMGTDERGADAVPKLHFPGLDPDAAQWLVDHRDIAAIGLDTPSIDRGQSEKFMAHRILFEANIPAFENVAALDQLPPSGSHIVALPMKIAQGSGGPLRVVAWVP